MEEGPSYNDICDNCGDGDIDCGGGGGGGIDGGGGGMPAGGGAIMLFMLSDERKISSIVGGGAAACIDLTIFDVAIDCGLISWLECAL